MGIDINTYRQRIGGFMGGHGCRVNSSTPFSSTSRHVAYGVMSDCAVWIVCVLFVIIGINLISCSPAYCMEADIYIVRCPVSSQATMFILSTLVIAFSSALKMIGAVSFVKTLLIMAGIESNPGPTDQFNFRYQFLLVELGTELLRKTFDDQLKGMSLYQYLMSRINKINVLVNKGVINGTQETLLPPKCLNPVLSTFDITLLSCLLRNICGLKSAGDTVWTKPAQSDLSLEADITRLRLCRNKLGHSGTVLIPEAQLNADWKELSQIMVCLNSKLINGVAHLQSKIDEAETMEIDENLKKLNKETLKLWEESDKAWDHGQAEILETVQRIEQRIEQNQNVLCDRLEQDNKKVHEHLGKLEESLSSVEQNVKAVEGKLDKTLKKSPQDIQQKLVQFYQQHCHTIPVSPLFDHKDEHLLKIYKNPTMNSEEHKKDSKQISGYKSIFYKEGVAVKQIYITGDAGVGKTSFCTRMCLLWSMAKSGYRFEKEDEELQKDMDFMSKFDFVFYINLRDTGHSHVINMIVEQLFYNSREKYESTIESILQDEPCLIILDSLDEWDPKTEETDKKQYKVPERIYSDQCFCLTTCRPYRIENVRLSHKKDVDHLIKITGLHGDSSQSYIEHVISYMNDEHSCNKNVDDFTDEVNKCGLTDQLCIPIFISHLVMLWFEKKALTDMPRALIYANILEMVFKRAELRNVKCPSSPPCTWQLPVSLSGMEHLNRYVSLLYNVCRLSFRAEFKLDENVSSLVFTRKQLQAKPYCFSVAETDFLCKIGILSKNEVFGCYTEERLKISFIHKSYMEVLAALFITSFDQSHLFTDITETWKSLDDVLQFENLFILLAGFSYDSVKLLFENIHKTIADDLSSCRSKAIFHNDRYSYQEQIKSLQTAVNKCYREVSSCYNPTNIVLKLEDFVFDDDDCSDTHSGNDDNTDDSQALVSSHAKSLKKLLKLNRQCVKSLYSVNGRYCSDFSQIKNLQSLNVGKIVSGDYEQFTQLISENKSTLNTLCIEGDFDTPPVIPELPVRKHHRLFSLLPSIIRRQQNSIKHLTSLSLEDVRMQHNSLQNLVKYLSSNVQFENISLDFVDCDNHQRGDSECTLTLNLSHHTKLSSLSLWYVNILCHDVNSSCLKYIYLCPFSERIVSCYINVLQCLKDSQLECLYISGDNKLDYNTSNAVVLTSKSLPCIKHLTLGRMNLSDDVLLHPAVTQVEIHLGEVTMSHQLLHSFTDIKSVKHIALYECKISSVETHREMTEEESFVYMSEYLTNLPTVTITYKGGDKDEGRGFDGYLLEFVPTSCM